MTLKLLATAPVKIFEDTLVMRLNAAAIFSFCHYGGIALSAIFVSKVLPCMLRKYSG